MVKRTVLALLLVAICGGFAPFPACEDVTPNWLYDGYCWHNYPVPGLPSYATQYSIQPVLVTGKAMFYAPFVMEATANWREMSLDDYLGGVALMTCGSLGEPVWLRRPDHDWEGPYRVVDCARRNDLYGLIVYWNDSVEVDWKTARRWGMVSGTWENWIVNEWMIRDVLTSRINPADLTMNKSTEDYSGAVYWPTTKYKPIYSPFGTAPSGITGAGGSYSTIQVAIQLSDWFLGAVEYSVKPRLDWADKLKVVYNR